jgi:hypothetical protein
MSGAIPPLLQQVIMGWCSVKKRQRDNCTSFLPLNRIADELGKEKFWGVNSLFSQNFIRINYAVDMSAGSMYKHHIYNHEFNDNQFVSRR